MVARGYKSGMLNPKNPNLAGAMASGNGGLKADFDDLVSTLRAYVKQETLGPIRGLGRYLGFGLAGTACFAVAEVFLVLGVVRVLQSTNSVFQGNLGFVPYLAGFATCVAFISLTIFVLKRDQKRHANE